MHLIIPKSPFRNISFTGIIYIHIVIQVDQVQMEINDVNIINKVMLKYTSM